MSRQAPELRVINLDRDSECEMLRVISEIGEHLIAFHKEKGHDELILYAKRCSSLARVIWQQGGTAEALEKQEWLFQLIIYFLELTKPEITYGYTELMKGGRRIFIPNYGLCTVGYIGRSLPYCSTQMVIQKEMETYETFKQRKVTLTEDQKTEVYEWAREYYRNLRPARAGTQSNSATWERNRSDGGFIDLCSQFYKTVKYTNYEDLPEGWVRNWRMGHEVGILETGTVNQKILNNESFIYALSHDILEKYLTHAEECVRTKECLHPELHLPAMPVGIKELGGKVRVPCQTTGFLNNMLEQIRAMMFNRIKRDERTSFRLKGGDKVKRLHQFLAEFDDSDIIHSADLTRSTDYFPFEFAEMVCKALWDMDLLTPWDRQAFLLATGPIRMVMPTDQNQVERTQNYTEKPEHIRDKLQSLFPLQPLTLQGKRFGFDPEEYQREQIRKGKGNATLICTYYQYGPTELPEVRNRIGKIEHTPMKSIYPGGLEYRLTLESELTSLDHQYDPQYLTDTGLQMSTSISIALLYSFNLFCDDQARKKEGAKGTSQICGDDALRAGNGPFIKTYKEKMIELGCQFSETKDVTGRRPRGVFTEILFEGTEILNVPKVKLIVRPAITRGAQAPEWIRALHAINSIRAPNGIIRTSLESELLEKFEEFFDILGPNIPLGLPRELGGLGKAYPLSEENQNIWNQIRSVSNPIVALELLRMFQSPYRIENFQGTLRPKLSLGWIRKLPTPTPVSEEYDEITLGKMYREGKILWQYLVDQRLRGSIEASILLDSPPQPVRFISKDVIQQILTKFLLEISEIKEQLKDLEMLPKPRSESAFIQEIYKKDVSTKWLKLVLGERV